MGSFLADVWSSTKAYLIRLWEGFRKVAPKVLGPILAVLLLVVSFILLTMGFKELQVGGLLGKLLGKKDDDSRRVIDLANSVDKDRVTPDGKLIQPGQPDSKGVTQAQVVPIKPPGLLSDPKTVIFTPPGESKPVKVVLPDGVTNRDVEQVVVVKPNLVVATVKDNSKLPAKRIDELLAKYGRS